MKKIMVVLAAVAMAACAQAGSFKWNVDSAFIPGTSTGIESGDGYYAYFMIDSVTAGTYANAYAYTSAQSDLANGDASFLSKAYHSVEIDDGADGRIEGLADGNTVKGYLVILDSDTIKDATMAYITTLETSNITGMGTGNAIDWEDLTGTKDPGSWSKVGAVPEPTSGLLLLLGVAGLALRRRRA